MTEVWKRCSTCKKDIAFKATYYVCNVSTCRRKRTGFVFCSVACWDEHLPLMRHREAWAEEETAPTQAQWAAEQSKEPKAAPAKKPPPGRVEQVPLRRRIVANREPAAQTPSGAPKEVLVVASRLKNFIKAAHDMNCSDGVLEPLSEEIRRLANRAVQKATEDGRKTVLERDFDFLKS